MIGRNFMNMFEKYLNIIKNNILITNYMDIFKTFFNLINKDIFSTSIVILTILMITGVLYAIYKLLTL